MDIDEMASLRFGLAAADMGIVSDNDRDVFQDSEDVFSDGADPYDDDAADPFAPEHGGSRVIHDTRLL